MVTEHHEDKLKSSVDLKLFSFFPRMSSHSIV